MKLPLPSYLLFALLMLGLSSCQLGRFVVYNFADIKDHKKFKSHPLQASDAPFSFHLPAAEKGPKSVTMQGKTIPFDEYIASEKTVAFMIIRNDTILYERYFSGYDTTSIVPSFSMAKSVTSILMGCALEDGLIRSIKDPITAYIPELQKKKGFEKITIEHLLQMTSGIEFNESYVNPFGHAASIYYGLNLRRVMKKMKIKHEPGTKFHYSSGDTQLLGWILHNALGEKTLTEYLQEKLWQPLGMEYDASWSIDSKKNDLEKTFCCINARARDFAKIGRLYLNKGNWNGQQIVPESWVEMSTKIDETNGSVWFYQHQWWMSSKNGDYQAEGILGQFVYVNPEKNVIIVRLGKKYGDASWNNIFKQLAKKY